MGSEHNDDPGLPIKLWPCSNGEYVAPPRDELQAEAMRRARDGADDYARRHGQSRRQFLLSSAGLAAGAVALESATRDRTKPPVEADGFTSASRPRSTPPRRR